MVIRTPRDLFHVKRYGCIIVVSPISIPVEWSFYKKILPLLESEYLRLLRPNLDAELRVLNTALVVNAQLDYDSTTLVLTSR